MAEKWIKNNTGGVLSVMVLERGGDDPASRTGYQFATLHAGDTVKVDYGGPFLNGLVIGGQVNGNVVFTAAVVQQRGTPPRLTVLCVLSVRRAAGSPSRAPADATARGGLVLSASRTNERPPGRRTSPGIYVVATTTEVYDGDALAAAISTDAADVELGRDTRRELAARRWSPQTDSPVPSRP